MKWDLICYYSSYVWSLEIVISNGWKLAQLIKYFVNDKGFENESCLFQESERMKGRKIENID